MMKLLFKPTGHIFTLPDEEAIKIKQSDRGNYQILDAGYVEQEETEVVSEKTVAELVLQQEERVEEIENEDKEEEAKEVKPTLEELKEPIKRIDDMSEAELEALAQRSCIKYFKQKNKKTLIKELKEIYGE